MQKLAPMSVRRTPSRRLSAAALPHSLFVAHNDYWLSRYLSNNPFADRLTGGHINIPLQAAPTGHPEVRHNF